MNLQSSTKWPFCFTVIMFLFVSCDLVIHRDAAVEELNASRFQLLEVLAEIVTSQLDQEQEGAKFDIERAISDIGKKKGTSFFRCETRTNLWLHLNPDSKKWASADDFESEIAIYNPISFALKPGQSLVRIGITFGGKQVRLSNAPAWEPFPIWELEKTK